MGTMLLRMPRGGPAIVAMLVLCVGFTPLRPAHGSGSEWWEGWSMADPRLSQPVYSDSVFESMTFVADDEVAIHASVLRPVVPEGTRVPAIMQLSPYLPMEMQPGNILPTLQVEQYVQRGYALVGVSVRGTGASGGCIDYQGERDRADVDAILDGIAAQSWSNGKIGGTGLSWDGTTLNAAATSGNPHLRTIVPVAAITDWYKWSFLKGIPTWYVGYTFNAYAPPVLMGVASGGVRPEHAHQRLCPTLFESIVAQEHSAALGVRTEWWDDRDLVRFAEEIDAGLAVLQVQGYRDEGVRLDHLHEWDAALRERLPNYRLLIGDWNHMWPDTPDLPAFHNPDVRFNPNPLTSWNVILLRWFDQWLKERDTGILDLPPALLQDDQGNWHEEDGLQPSRAVTTTLFPAPGGVLGAQPVEGTLSFLDNGLGVDPRGSCLYIAGGIFIGCAPVAQPNAQFFVTEPYETETRLSGIARAHLELTHSAPRGQVGVTLYEIDGEKWTPITYGFASYNLRDGDYEHSLVDPGEVFHQTIEMIARDFVMSPGHRLGVAIGSQVGRNPMGLAGNGYAPIPSGGTTSVLLGSGTHVELSVLPGHTPTLPLP